MSFDSRLRDLGSLKLTHLTLSLILMLNPNFNFPVLLDMSKPILIRPNFQTKTKIPRAHAKSQIRKLCSFLPEMQNEYYSKLKLRLNISKKLFNRMPFNLVL